LAVSKPIKGNLAVLSQCKTGETLFFIITSRQPKATPKRLMMATFLDRIKRKEQDYPCSFIVIPSEGPLRAVVEGSQGVYGEDGDPSTSLGMTTETGDVEIVPFAR
jgi:hypothetical protein